VHTTVLAIWPRGSRSPRTQRCRHRVRTVVGYDHWPARVLGLCRVVPWSRGGLSWSAVAWSCCCMRATLAWLATRPCRGCRCIAWPMWGLLRLSIHLPIEALLASTIPSHWRLCRCSSLAARAMPWTCRPISLPHDTFPPSRGHPVQMLTTSSRCLSPLHVRWLCVWANIGPRPSRQSRHHSPRHDRSRAPFAFKNSATFDFQFHTARSITIQFLAPTTRHGSYLATPLTSGYSHAP
jgi:hypothetical protein